jgi:hypothetical protein
MASSVEKERFLVITRCCWFFGVFFVMFFSRDSIVGFLSISPLVTIAFGTALPPPLPLLVVVGEGWAGWRFLRA